jgi:hypothetical protein
MGDHIKQGDTVRDREDDDRVQIIMSGEACLTRCFDRSRACVRAPSSAPWETPVRMWRVRAFGENA